METPYLVARAEIRENNSREGIDSIISIEYMGAAEYEFGAIPQSLKRIRTSIDQYTKFDYKFKGSELTVRVFSKSKDQEEIKFHLENLAHRKIPTKGGTSLPELVFPEKGRERWRQTNFWWDISNDFMFWLPKEGFEEKFDEKIKSKN